MTKQILKIRFFLLLINCFFPIISIGQCAMCRAALETEGNTQKAKAVNDGIVYLMVIPYLLAAIIGFIIYRMVRKNNNSKEI